MASLDPTALMNSIKDDAREIVQGDIVDIEGFSQTQLQLLAQQAQGITEMQLAGVFEGNDALRDHFVQQLEEMTRNFVRVMRGLAAITAERLWNSVVNTLWGAIGKATGMALPLPVGGLAGITGMVGLAGSVARTLRT